MRNKIKIVAISDTHGLHDRMTHPMPKGDVLIHAGDFSNSGSIVDVKKFNFFLQKVEQLYQHVIVIAGNHDWAFQRSPQLAEDVLLENLTRTHYLFDKEIELEGVRFYGSPWQPEFCNWAFNVPRGQALATIWSKIPDDTDVLITHGPPYNILDEVAFTGIKAGCEDLADRILQVRPKLHIFGHIHVDSKWRSPQLSQLQVNGCTTHINASICNESYDPVNKPVEFELEK